MLCARRAGKVCSVRGGRDEAAIARIKRSEIRNRHSSSHTLPDFTEPVIGPATSGRTRWFNPGRTTHAPLAVGVPPRLLLRRPNATAQLRLRASWDAARTGATRLQPVPVLRAVSVGRTSVNWENLRKFRLRDFSRGVTVLQQLERRHSSGVGSTSSSLSCDDRNAVVRRPHFDQDSIVMRNHASSAMI
jgi:hypothetical protein